MRVPASPLAAIGPGLVLLRHDGDLATVQKLEHEEKDLVANRVDWDDPSGSRGVNSSRSGGVEAGRWVRPTKEFSEEETPRREYAAVRVAQTALHAESDVAEGLPVDEEVEVIQRKRSQRLFKGHGGAGDGASNCYCYLFPCKIDRVCCS